MSNLDFVNTKLGSDSNRRFSNGNITPIVACPFGMAHFSIHTFKQKGFDGNWFYSPNMPSFEGIRLTHQPSPWAGDYGHMLFLPFTGKYIPVEDDNNRRWSSYNLGREILKPSYMEVYLNRYRTRVSLAPTMRGAIIHASSDKPVSLAVIPFDDSEFHLEGNVLTGWTGAQYIWDFKGLREYFYIEFSATPARLERGEDGGVGVCFNETEFTARVATSFISLDQAKENFCQELRDRSVEDIQSSAEKQWRDRLDSIQVSDENPERKKMFYSCMYRAHLYPRTFHEFGADGKPVHYNADTCTVEPGVLYVDTGFWDTFRTQLPLLSILDPALIREIVEGFVNYAEETGYMPKWLSPGETGVMPGSLGEAMMADACVKGIVTGELLQRVYRVLLRSAYQTGDKRNTRIGLAEYMELGYVSNTIRESINNTLDSAYGDWCVAQVALLVGDTENYHKLMERSKNYANLFDKKTGFFRAKDTQGNFVEPCNEFTWCIDNCEGSYWQNSFAVYHDFEGLAKLHGGREKLIAKLDAVFATPPVFDAEEFGQEIHEMTELALVDFGQCAISNQPSFHIPWMYSILGQQDKTEYWIERLVNEAFCCSPKGFPGDEDNGSMASWYIFACLGYYPICPGKNEYAMSKPLFEKIEICRHF